jgi:hypothetical protein
MIVARQSFGLGQDATAGGDVFGQAMNMWQWLMLAVAAFVLFRVFKRGRG